MGSVSERILRDDIFTGRSVIDCIGMASSERHSRTCRLSLQANVIALWRDTFRWPWCNASGWLSQNTLRELLPLFVSEGRSISERHSSMTVCNWPLPVFLAYLIVDLVCEGQLSKSFACLAGHLLSDKQLSNSRACLIVDLVVMSNTELFRRFHRWWWWRRWWWQRRWQWRWWVCFIQVHR